MRYLNVVPEIERALNSSLIPRDSSIPEFALAAF